MRVRTMSATGDMTFGGGSANFLVNSPAAVAQLAQTRVLLWTGQWYLDFTEGTPYPTQILGTHTQSLYDNAIVTRLLQTTGVTSLQAYSSQMTDSTRNLKFSATLNTLYSVTEVASTVFS